MTDHFELAKGHFLEGLSLFERQDYVAAEEQFRSALALIPDRVSVLNNLSGTLVKLGQFSEAKTLASRAVSIDGQAVDGWLNLGICLHELKRLDEALASYDQAIKLKPDYASAFYNRGVTLQEMKRLDEALASYDQAIRLKPDHADAYCNRGNALQELKRFDEALASYDEAIKHRPDYAEPYNNRGFTLQELKRMDEALADYDEAIKRKPDYAGAFNNRGLTLQKLKRYGDALVSFEKALTIKPDSAETLSNRGLALHELRRYDEALESYDKAQAIEPGLVEAFGNRGLTLHDLRRYEEALASYDMALTIKPDYAEAFCNRGNALHELERYDEALASYEKATALMPDYALAHFNESICRLLTGDFERGWKKFQWRWKTDSAPAATRSFLHPLWLGEEDIAGKTILLHAEQGLGDTIQFARYTHAVAQKGVKVILEVQPPLKPLLSTLSGAYQVMSRGEPLPEVDFHCPLLSLPLAFNTRLETIPTTIPYLSVGETTVSARRRNLSAGGTRLVGLCWKGSTAYKKDRDRSVRLTELLPLLTYPGVRFVSLQKELDDEERALTAGMANFIHPGADFKGTAEIVAALDLVITVDTSWAHWAGAIGKPLWVLLPAVPHWCWLLGRDDSPWYPTARLFRQTRSGDWRQVIESARHEISRMSQ